MFSAGTTNQVGIPLDDTLSTTFPDTDHSGLEPRFLTLGVSRRNRVLVVVHTEEDELIRIISAR